ncbi:diacylglycerol kinase family lipid kinase [Candidatus Dependentiae bacterium]|nr:diacylglycerol kinase family lipid kinase [Candidatus Dependentiae bacterium]
MKEKIKFIINPKSGEDKTANFIRRIKHYCEFFKIDSSISVTKGKSHGIELADDAMNHGFHTIVAVGGDGTVHEVIHGLAGKKLTLGVIPFGSSNDFARGLNIPRDVKEAMRIIAKRKIKEVDIVAMNDQFFINISSLGFDGEVVANLPKMKSKHLFKFVYILGVLKEAFRYKKKKVRVIRDDVDMGIFNVNLIAIANGKYYGHGMLVAPHAELDNGLLDVVLIHELSQLRFVMNFPSVFKGTHIYKDGVLNFTCKKLVLLSDEKVYIESDGELTGTLPVEYKVFPKFQKLIVP